MSKMTNDEIRERLKLVDPKKLTGQTPERFRQVWRITGVFWSDVLNYFAEEGFAWKDAAALYGVTERTLRGVVARRGVKVPWQGHRSERARQERSERQMGKPFYFPPKKMITAFGKTASMNELIAEFGHPDTTYATVCCRIQRGWDPEEALTVPRGLKAGKGGHLAKKKQEAA